MPLTATETARVFCSYSHRDAEFRSELEAHLAPLTRQQLITFWYDRRIVPGNDWTGEIAAELNGADIILLLISHYFISSDYCYQVELGRALQRHKEGSAVVIPIYVRPCDWEGLEFSTLQGLPSDGVPVTEQDNQDKAWALVVKGIRQARNDLISLPKPDPNPQPMPTAAEVETYETNAYLRHLVTFKRKQGEAFSLQAEINGHTESLDDALHIWAQSKFRPLLLLVGKAGSGKTWAFRHLAAKLAEGVLSEDRASPQPIYVPFHTMQNEGGITAIYKAVPEGRGVLERYKTGSNTVFLLDGIDEGMFDSLDTGLRMLVEVLDGLSQNAGIAISSRVQVSSELLTGLKHHGYQPLVCTIREPDKKALQDYFMQSGVDVRGHNATQIDSPQPPLVQVFWREFLKGAESQNIPNLYTEVITRALRSAQKRDKRVAMVPLDILRSFLINLACQMFPSVNVKINEVQLTDEWNSEKFDIINGLVDSGLLTIDAREFISFAHMSLFEFFFARLLFEEFSSWNATHLSRSNLIYSYNVNRLLIPMLLDSEPEPLTPLAALDRKELEQNAVVLKECVLSSPILRRHFIDFVNDTGWRRDTGFGQWLTFTDPSGALNASDGTIDPELHAISLAGPPDEDYAVSLSWYDAYQFARWIGASLPSYMEIPSEATADSPTYEWTSSWFKESESLILVRRASNNDKHGVNPDVRSSEIGFRVRLS